MIAQTQPSEIVYMIPYTAIGLLTSLGLTKDCGLSTSTLVNAQSTNYSRQKCAQRRNDRILLLPREGDGFVVCILTMFKLNHVSSLSL